MQKDTISSLLAYNFWANQRILAACEHLSVDEFTRPVTPDPGWGTLRGILVHALDTEYGWRTVLQGQDASQILTEGDFTSVAALQARWQIEQAAWVEYVAGLSTENLHKRYSDDPNGPTVWQTILHVIVHGVQHRSEAAAILTGYNHSPGELDFDCFLSRTKRADA
jgi:uncharacterized damage-inducible protein DinB